MKRLIPYIAFAYVTGFSATSVIPVMAGGCSSHMNKTAQIECSEEDIDCQTENDEKFNLKQTAKS